MTASTLQPAHQLALTQPRDFSAEQVELIKNTVAAGTSDLELALFLEVAKSSGLNPFQRQIYAVMRWDAKTRKEKMVIQTGIDGYRLIAARSGVHMGTTDPEFGPVNKEGFPEFARVIVRKLVHGHVAEFPATARWSEYVQMGKEGPTAMWKRMPHTMLGKCAEALALRKTFPAELSGVYSDVEMAQADNAAPAAQEAPPVVQQEAKAAPDEAHIREWGPKLAGLRSRLKTYGVKDSEVGDVLAEYDWRSNVEAATQAHARLTEWGLKLKAEREAQVSETDTDVVDAELKPAPEVPPFEPVPAKPADTDPIGPDRAHRLHKYLGVVLKGTEYEGKHDLFAGEAVGHEVTHLQDLLVGEARLLNDYIEEFKAERQAVGA